MKNLKKKYFVLLFCLVPAWWMMACGGIPVDKGDLKPTVHDRSPTLFCPKGTRVFGRGCMAVSEKIQQEESKETIRRPRTAQDLLPRYHQRAVSKPQQLPQQRVSRTKPSAIVKELGLSACIPGEERECGECMHFPSCDRGRQRCQRDGTWGVCGGGTYPPCGPGGTCSRKRGYLCYRSTCLPIQCRPGEYSTCGTDKGICRKGGRICSNYGTWGACQGHKGPAPQEICNGKDDDCDGSVDENCLKACTETSQCATDETCRSGGCTKIRCYSGMKACGHRCVRTINDANHCGACGNVCGKGQRCSSGFCNACTVIQTSSGKQCLYLESDYNNCGKIGRRCQGRESCYRGQCKLMGVSMEVKDLNGGKVEAGDTLLYTITLRQYGVSLVGLVLDVHDIPSSHLENIKVVKKHSAFSAYSTRIRFSHYCLYFREITVSFQATIRKGTKSGTVISQQLKVKVGGERGSTPKYVDPSDDPNKPGTKDPTTVTVE